jgi:signal transduction histidine kinase
MTTGVITTTLAPASGGLSGHPERASSQPERSDGSPRVCERASVVDAILRVPLLGKLLGANLVIVIAALAGHNYMPWSSTAVALGLALVLSFAVTAVLTWLALRPVAELEATADRVSHGDFSARVSESILADREIQGLSATMNRLLDRVEADRERIQYLAGRSVRARDIERSTVARELRDSLAQLVSAIGMELSVARTAGDNTQVEHQIERARTLVSHLGDELRAIAEALHPGTLVELGLPNAIAVIARRVSRQSVLQVALDDRHFSARLSQQQASALYRAADEALRNVVQHADATNVRMSLRSDRSAVALEIEDDGRGMDFRHTDPLQAGLGLFSTRAVLALAGGELQISSAPGRGTLVRATLPLASDTLQS